MNTNLELSYQPTLTTAHGVVKFTREKDKGFISKTGWAELSEGFTE